jgi:hypothetical protein
MIARQQQPAAVRNLNPAYVCFGSKADKFGLSIRCPLCPTKRTKARISMASVANGAHLSEEIQEGGVAAGTV